MAGGQSGGAAGKGANLGRPPGSGGASVRPGRVGPARAAGGGAADRAADVMEGQAHQIANAQTVGPITELAKQIATNNQQNQLEQGQDFGYYMQLAQAAKDAVSGQAGVSAGLNSTLAGIGANTQTQLAGIGQQAQGGAVGRMNALGLGGSSAADLAAATAQQQGVGALNSQTFQSAGANMGAANQAQGLQQLGSTGLEGTAQIGQLARAGTLANEPVNAKIAALQASKGALYGTALGQLQSNQQKLEIAREALTGKSQALAATIANDQAKNSIAIRGQNVGQLNTQARLAQQNLDNLRTTSTSASNNAASNAERAAATKANNSTRTLLAQLKAAAAAGKPATPLQANTVYTHIDYVTGLLRQYMNNGLTPQQAYHYALVGGKVATGAKNSAGQPIYKTLAPIRFTNSLLNAAYNLLPSGSGLTPGDVAWMKSLGINAGSHYRVEKPGLPQSGFGGGATSGNVGG